MSDQPDAGQELHISLYPAQPVPVRFQHPGPDADVFHMVFFDPPAVLAAGSLQKQFCRPVFFKKRRHSVRMVIMGVRQHRTVHIRKT